MYGSAFRAPDPRFGRKKLKTIQSDFSLDLDHESTFDSIQRETKHTLK